MAQIQQSFSSLSLIPFSVISFQRYALESAADHTVHFLEREYPIMNYPLVVLSVCLICCSLAQIPDRAHYADEITSDLSISLKDITSVRKLLRALDKLAFPNAGERKISSVDVSANSLKSNQTSAASTAVTKAPQAEWALESGGNASNQSTALAQQATASSSPVTVTNGKRFGLWLRVALLDLTCALTVFRRPEVPGLHQVVRHGPRLCPQELPGRFDLLWLRELSDGARLQ